MHLTTEDLDNVVEGKSSLIELCGLQDVYCHMKVISFLSFFIVRLQLSPMEPCFSWCGFHFPGVFLSPENPWESGTPCILVID